MNSSEPSRPVTPQHVHTNVRDVHTTDATQVAAKPCCFTVTETDHTTRASTHTAHQLHPSLPSLRHLPSRKRTRARTPPPPPRRWCRGAHRRGTALDLPPALARPVRCVTLMTWLVMLMTLMTLMTSAMNSRVLHPGMCPLPRPRVTPLPRPRAAAPAAR